MGQQSWGRTGRSTWSTGSSGWGGRTAGQGLKPRRRGLWEKGGQPRGAQGFVLGALWAVSASAGG